MKKLSEQLNIVPSIKKTYFNNISRKDLTSVIL